MRCQANLSLNQTKNRTGTIQKDLGRQSITPRYIEHASSMSQVLGEFYMCEKQVFVTETKSGVVSVSKELWTVWSPIAPLVNKVMTERKVEDSSDYLIKVMGDTGQGKTKICFCICSLYENKIQKRK